MSKVPCLIGTFDGGTLYNSMNASGLPGKMLNHRRMFLDRVVDLRKEQIDNLFQVWNRCERWPTTVTTDDEQQLRPRSDDHSPVLLYPSTVLLKTAKNFSPHKPLRADEKYFRLCMQIRSNWTQAWWDRMTQSCVFEEGTEDRSTIRILFRHEPTTISLAVAKEAVHILKQHCDKGIVREEGFCRSFATGRRPANPITLHKHERVMITHNLSKTQGIVNGEIGRVLEITGNVIFVNLTDGPLIPVTVLSSEEGLCAPLVRGHALTIAKAIGATIPHATLYCEGNMSAPGCGYVASTRVKHLHSILTMGFSTERFF